MTTSLDSQATHHHSVEQRHTARRDTAPWALIAAAQGGDREAFGELYARYQPQILRYIVRRVGDYEAARDLAGDTFVKAHRNLGSVSNQGLDPAAWLTTIARNLVLDHAKSHRVRREQLTDDIPEPRTSGGVYAEAAGPEEQVLNAQRHATARAVLAEAMRGLTPRQRQALELYEQAPEKGHAGVAAATGCSVAAVKALRVRALVTMRAALSQQGLSSSAQVCDELPDPIADSARARVSLQQARDALPEPLKEPDGHQGSDGVTPQCLESLGRAQDAVAQLTRHRHRPPDPRSTPAADRWAELSVAAAVGEQVSA